MQGQNLEDVDENSATRRDRHIVDIKKTALLAMEANKILNEKEENVGKTKQREGTLVENLKRTLSKHRELLTVNSKLAALNDPTNTTRDKKSKVEKLETAAREAMGS